MKRIVFALIALIAINLTQARAQQIPYLDELIPRLEEFNQLLTEKRKAGASLSSIEPLRQKTESAFVRGNIPEILALVGEATASLQGKKWDEREKFLSSLSLDVNRSVIEPNTDIQATLTRMFPSDIAKAFASPPTVTFEIAPLEKWNAQASPSTKPIIIAERISISETGAAGGRKLRLADGAYWVIARIESNGQKAGEVKKLVFAIGDFTNRIDLLSKRIDGIKNSADEKIKSVAHLVSTAEFQLQRLAPLNNAKSDKELFPPDQLDEIEAALDDLEKGENPYADETGEIEQAYQAKDGKLIPYRLYIPESYDGKTARPLVVMLHGALGDERTYFSKLYDPAAIKGEADRRGAILASVNGRGLFPSYTGPGRDDVMEVIRAVTRDYKTDSARIYLTGHSMGGGGAWTVAASAPEIFAAIAPVSAALLQQGDAMTATMGKLKNIPVLVVHGNRDGIAPIARSRDAAAAAKKAGLTIEYIEVPEADHTSIVGATFSAVMDFFERRAKRQN
jgi:predicted esterase